MNRKILMMNPIFQLLFFMVKFIGKIMFETDKNRERRNVLNSPLKIFNRIESALHYLYIL